MRGVVCVCVCKGVGLGGCFGGIVLGTRRGRCALSIEGVK